MIDKIYELAESEGLFVVKVAEDVVAVGFQEMDDKYDDSYDVEMSNRLDKVVDELTLYWGMKELFSVEHSANLCVLDVYSLFKV